MVDQTTGWQPDPYGAHEFRFFSADGKPTLLVMDGGKTSYDRPPTAEPPPDLERPSSPRPVPPPAPEPPLSPEPEPPPAPVTPTALAPAATAFGADQVSTRSTAHTTDADNVASAAALLQPRTSILAVTDFVDDRSVGGVGQRSPEAISRPLKIAYGIVFVALALSLLGLVYVHFHHAGGRPSEHAEGTTTTTSAPRTTTTTVVLPTALKPGAEAAATTLVSNWATGNRAAALTVATPAAVTALFTVPYASGLAIDRGCSTSFTPIVCTFGPPGDASPNDPIYEIDVSQAAGGWYVSSVKIENLTPQRDSGQGGAGPDAEAGDGRACSRASDMRQGAPFVDPDEQESQFDQ